MGFQAAVKTDPAIGIPGQEVNPRQAVYTAFNFVSDGTVPAGGFAFAVALNGTSQTEQNVLSAKAEAGAKPVGFVERDVIATIPAPTDDATQVYPKGTCPPVAIRGQFYAIATGAVTYGTAGATNDTGWTVVFPRGVKTIAEGDTVIYQNFGVDKAA